MAKGPRFTLFFLSEQSEPGLSSVFIFLSHITFLKHYRGPINFMMSAPRLPSAVATLARTDSPFFIWMFEVLWRHRQQTNDLCVRSSSIFLFGLGNAEESGIGRSKTLWTGSRPFSRNMRRLVSASSIPAGNWGMRLPIRLDMPEKRIMGNAFSILR